jgi:hypothetical protein
MISLATPITQQNATRLELLRLALYDDVSIARVTLGLRSPPAGNRILLFELTIRNGLCDVLQAKAAPSTWNDIAEVVSNALTAASGYDTIEAAYNGGSKAARKRAVETALLSLGVIHANLTGDVS